MELKRQLGLVTGILIIVADMIGTGIFMTTGNILRMTQSALIVLLLWGIGGLVAITGALCYAELAALWPAVGGEYVYLKNIYGLLPAFLTGWISLAALLTWTKTSLFAIAIVALGVPLFYLWRRFAEK